MCGKCNKKYARRQHIIRHVKYECGKQPVFQCPQCHRKYKRKDVLLVHLRNIHEIFVPPYNLKKPSSEQHFIP